jgi:hypothetical protein
MACVQLAGLTALWGCWQPPQPEEKPASLADACLAWSVFLHRQFCGAPIDLDELGPTIMCLPLEGRRGYFVGALSYHNDSFGNAAVFTVRSGYIDKTWWLCEGGAVSSIQCIQLNGLPHPAIEVIEHTGHGNGCVQIYSFERQTLKLMLVTRAYDCGDDGDILLPPTPDDDNVLQRKFVDLNDDGLDDVLFTGWAQVTIECRDGFCCEIDQRLELVRKGFAFNPGAGVFEELVKYRLGPDHYHDEDLWRGIASAR